MNPGYLDVVTITYDETGVGTEERIHLNNDFGIFTIKEWNPLAPPPEDIFQSSPFEDGRIIASRKYGNIADEFTIDASGPDGPTVDNEIRRLRAILKKAVDYWVSDWADEPVWLEMRGDNEDYVRYSYIYAWDLPGETNFFQPPRSDCPVLVMDLKTVIEHSLWMDSLTGACVPISAQQDYSKINNADYVPTQSEDDCYTDITGTSITLNSNIRLGKNNVGNSYGSGIRFRGLAVPKNATITRAYITFRAESSLANNTVNTNFYGELNATPLVFSTYADWAGRALTAAIVAWNSIPGQVAGSYYDTPDLTTIVQEIVNLPGWATGHNLVIINKDNGSSVNASRFEQSWDSVTDPVLHVEWTSSDLTFGMSENCTDPIYFADRHNMAQLTHVFYYDASGASYSANIIGTALPQNLLPAVPAIGDIIYFIVDTLAPNSGPFGSLVFDLANVDPGMTGVWEYWNGAWVSVGWIISDHTAQLTTPGVSDVVWQQMNDWVTTIVNGITGYIVRFRVTGVTGNRPQQQNREMFTINTPFIDIDSARVGGDVSMLTEFRMHELGNDSWSRRLGFAVLGLRTLKRGADFSAYINLADEQNNAGLTIGGSGVSAFADDVTSETGRALYWNSSGTTWELVATILFSPTLAAQYRGSFMTYVRARYTTTSDQYQIKYTLVMQNQVYFESPVVNPVLTSVGTDRIGIAALGEMNFFVDAKNLIYGAKINVYAKTTNAANDAYFHTFIMMPNDEWIGNYSSMSNNADVPYGYHLSVDPITRIKLRSVACGRKDTTLENWYIWDDKSPHLPMLHEKETQRLWLFHPATVPTGVIMAYCGHAGRMYLKSIKRYFSTIT